MNVLVIPEDFRKDQYMLKPLIEALMRSAGRKKARVRVCRDPLLGGVSQALKWSRLEEIIVRYKGMIDVFLLCVDRDGITERRKSLDHLETKATQFLPEHKYFLAENAWQELEVWVLAGQKDLPGDWNWQDIRQERDPKEAYFIPFSHSRDLVNEPGEGRRTLAREAAGNFTRVLRLCPELNHLRDRLQALITT
ncbi:MAG: hypothetical protein QNK37_26465 [Acidobacteriota bacterium]|nr:hypothetical protein [Acidobacteriota bacterium]